MSAALRVLTVPELLTQRRLLANTADTARELHRLGYQVPAELLNDMAALAGETVAVAVPCMICPEPQHAPVAIAEDGIPKAVICTRCDEQTTAEVAHAIANPTREEIAHRAARAARRQGATP